MASPNATPRTRARAIRTRDSYGFEVPPSNINLTADRLAAQSKSYAGTSACHGSACLCRQPLSLSPLPLIVCVQVRAEYIALYKQYAPLWEKEESERTARWNRFLADFQPQEPRCAASVSREHFNHVSLQA